MAELITMPKLSDTMEEGGISEWLVKEGENFEEGDPLLSIETDKATLEYPSPFSGTLLKIIAKEGQSCQLQEPIAVFGEKGESFDLEALLKTTKTSAKKEVPAKEKTEKKETVSAEATTTAVETTQAAPPVRTNTRIKASPLAKKIAKSKNIDLNTLLGTGPHGRIIAKDLEGLSSGMRKVQRQDVKVPHSMMRKTIAKRLLSAKNDAPHFYLTVSANMESMIQWRTALNKQKAVLSGEAPKVSINDLLIFTVSKALAKHPEVNSSWQDDGILQYGNVNVAFAVALPSGLITPVIFQSDSLPIHDIARQSKALGAKAKKGELQPEDYAGGTFTISNLGMTLIEEFTAIINPPQSCILAVGQTKKVPHVDENGNLVVQERMKMTLSCDHRVVDGMVGAKFLETLVSYLETPVLMMDA